MKKHLCKTCGETDPEKFYKSQSKRLCKNCRYNREKLYYEENKNKISDYQKDYQKEYGKKYRRHNQDSIKEYQKEYQREYQRKRKESDPSFRCINNIRSRQSKVLRGLTSTTKGLGCNRQELRDHLESLFTEGMSFDNYGKGPGKWNIDHKDPISLHDRDENGKWCTESERNKKLMHYTNMQPMWEADNIKKSNKILDSY